MPCNYNFSTFSVVGDCENTGSGSFTLYFSSSSEPISITWLSPNPWPPYYGGETTEILNNSDFPRTYPFLSAGTYVLRVNDSCGGPTATTQNNIQTVNIVVSSGSSCVNITNVVDTTCGLNNGSLTATLQEIFGTATFSLYKDGVFYTQGTSTSTQLNFDALPGGVYYVEAENGGGCTGFSENVIIQNSVSVQFGTYVVNDADCGNVATGVGKIFITGLTGTPPYTYNWVGENENAQYLVDTGQSLSGVSITGLTAGIYNVTVTDVLGCTNTISSEVTEKLPVSLGVVTTTPPTCFTSNGEITIEVINGTPPYRFSIPSLSFTDISYSQTYIFENLPGGFYNIVVTDAALCSFTTSVQINQSNSFALGPISISPPSCGNSNGSISISLIGNVNATNYVYTLSGSNGTIFSSTTSVNNIFSNLKPQNYQLTITDGICTYSQVINLSTSQLFTLTTDVTGSTCGDNNGVVTINKSSGGTSPFSYWIEDIDGNNNQSLNNTPFSSCTFNNLSPGNYIAYVSDGKRCEELTYFEITNSEPVNFILIPTDSTNGSNGQIITNIYQGTAPFTLTWSSNVNGQTSTTVTNLSAGTYTLTVEDSLGCVLSKSVELAGSYNASNFSIFNICDSTITSKGEFTERTLGKMLVEGFIDLISGCTNCLLNSAIFSAVTTVAGTGFSQSFYTATTLNSVPSEALWASTVQNLLSGVTGVGTVSVNLGENTITLDTSCEESNNALANQNVTVELKIVYDIDCESC
jgi:hypothetical protein